MSILNNTILYAIKLIYIGLWAKSTLKKPEECDASLEFCTTCQYYSIIKVECQAAHLDVMWIIDDLKNDVHIAAMLCNNVSHKNLNYMIQCFLKIVIT